MLHFEDKSYFYLTIAIVLLGIVFLLNQIWKHKKEKAFASSKMFATLCSNKSTSKGIFRFILMCFALLFVVIALVNPQLGTKTKNVKREGIDIVFAIDVSKSMLAQDAQPSRLKKAQHIVNEILKKLQGDRVGIVAYAGQAFPQLPLTTDYSAVRMFVQGLNTDMISSQGTAIEQALIMATSYFDMKQNTAKIIILLTDGEDHQSGALEVAQEISNKGISIYALGVGTEKGAPIPIKGKEVSYKKDREGNTVISKMNPNLLQEIAQAANGAYFSTQNTQEVVSQMDEIIQHMDKTEFEVQKIVDFDDKFQWFLVLSIGFLLLECIVRPRKTIWFKKRNLFKLKH